MTSIFTDRKAGIKITFVGFFWIVTQYGRLCAPIIVKFSKEEEASNILLTAKVKNFRGSFGEFRPREHKKAA